MPCEPRRRVHQRREAGGAAGWAPGAPSDEGRVGHDAEDREDEHEEKQEGREEAVRLDLQVGGLRGHFDAPPFRCPWCGVIRRRWTQARPAAATADRTAVAAGRRRTMGQDRKSTRLNSSHGYISYA